MSKYLRDVNLKNYTVNESTLSTINDFLVDKQTQFNNAVLVEPNISDADVTENTLLLSYIIRFDGKGYKLTEFAELKSFFFSAEKIERVIFILDSNKSERTNRMYGTHFEIRFDTLDINNCWVQVAAENNNVVDLGFFGITEILSKYSNNSGFVQNAWAAFAVQILGVLAGFAFSVLLAFEFAPSLKIDNSFAISLFFFFILFSNIWGVVNVRILSFLSALFPNIKFSNSKTNDYSWLVRGLIITLVSVPILWAVGLAFSWATSRLTEKLF